MGVTRQQGRLVQRSLFDDLEADLRPGGLGEGVTRAESNEEPQASAALASGRALTDRLMEEVCQRENLNDAYRRVESNRGVPGVDGMTVDELSSRLAEHKQLPISGLLDGSYRPSPVLGVKIPKPDGGERQLGIPTVVDRPVQQAMLQVLTGLLDPTFSDSSYGYRPGRSAHRALQKAREYVAEGRTIVVDLDLEKFFDRVNRDMLMARLARHVSDKRLLRIVRRFSEAGSMQDGVCIERGEGTPQGGPLSPILANLPLDDLDEELESRGHKFCRYADDCNIYVGSEAAGQRVLASATEFLEGKLESRVNRKKSASAPVEERKFLGYRLLADGRLGIAPESLQRFRDKIRKITSRSRGIGFEAIPKELRTFVIGWVSYFRLAAYRSYFVDLDGWVRRKLRCVRLKQLKGYRSMVNFFVRQGVTKREAWDTVLSGRRWWRLSRTPAASKAMPNQWFNELGLENPTRRFDALQVK